MTNINHTAYNHSAGLLHTQVKVCLIRRGVVLSHPSAFHCSKTAPLHISDNGNKQDVTASHPGSLFYVSGTQTFPPWRAKTQI